tara:strand:- start:601 stop:2595 length:1995 start_codon:yes stop_codon:yes gene_type:complete
MNKDLIYEPQYTNVDVNFNLDPHYRQYGETEAAYNKRRVDGFKKHRRTILAKLTSLENVERVRRQEHFQQYRSYTNNGIIFNPALHDDVILSHELEDVVHDINQLEQILQEVDVILATLNVVNETDNEPDNETKQPKKVQQDPMNNVVVPPPDPYREMLRRERERGEEKVEEDEEADDDIQDEKKEEDEEKEEEKKEEEENLPPPTSSTRYNPFSGAGAGAGMAHSEFRRLMGGQSQSLLNFTQTYKFNYDSLDVNNWNKEYNKYYNFFPYTSTTSDSVTALGDIDLNTRDIKMYLDYASLGYGDPTGTSTLVSVDNAQATIFTDDDAEVVIAFRGTETSNPEEAYLGIIPNDVLTDLNTTIKLASSLGWVGADREADDVMVHLGFNNYVEELYQILLDDHVRPNITKKFTIVGHSLGGVSAQIFAYRLYLEMKALGQDINIDSVWSYGGVKGMYSPFHAPENAINMFSINYYRDPVPYWFPVFGDSLGTKVILYEGGQYEVYYRDQITPYLGINLGNSAEYFFRLRENAEYKNQKLTAWYRYLREKVGSVYNFATEDKILTYAAGMYSVALSRQGDVNQHKITTGYNISVGNLPDVDISIRKTEDTFVAQQNPRPYEPFDYNLFENVGMGENGNFHNYKKNPPKILGYVMNYTSSMDGYKIIF